MAEKTNELQGYLENDNVKWVVYNILKSEADKTSDGSINLGGFNQNSGDSSAFGAGQFIGSTRQEVLDRYGVDAWSENMDEQELAIVGQIARHKGDIEKIMDGDFTPMKQSKYWEAFYDEKTNPNTKFNNLTEEKPENWLSEYDNLKSTAVYDPDSSWSKIDDKVKEGKSNLFTGKYKDVVPDSLTQTITGVIPKVENDNVVDGGMLPEVKIQDSKTTDVVDGGILPEIKIEEPKVTATPPVEKIQENITVEQEAPEKSKIISGGFGMNPDGTVTIDRAEEEIDKPKVEEPVEEKKEEVGSVDAKNIKEVDGELVVEVPSDNEWMQEVQQDGTIDYSFFNKGEDDAIGILRNKYPGFDFNTEWVGKKEGGGISAIKISTKDGKNSAVFDVNIEGVNLYGGPNSPTTKEGRTNSYNTLTNFIEQYETKKTISLYDVNKNQRRKLFNKVNNEIKTTITPILNKIQADYESGDLFKEKIEEKYVEVGKIGIAPPQKIITKTQPYKEELEQAYKFLFTNLRKGERPEDITQQQIQEKALEYINKNAKRAALKQWMENNTSELAMFSRFGDGKGLVKRYEMAAKEFDIDFRVDMAELEISRNEFDNSKGAKKYKDYITKLNDPEYSFPVKITDDLVFINSGKVVPRKTLQEISSLQKALKLKRDEVLEAEERLMEKLPTYVDNPMAIDIASRNYNDVEKFFAGAAIGMAETFLVDIPYGLNATFGVPAEKTSDTVLQLKNSFQKARNSFSENIQFKDAFKSGTNFFKFAMQETATQIPVFATLAIPGIGIGALHFSATGRQYSNLVAESRTLGGRKMSKSAMWWNSQGYALAETGFNYVTTLPLIRAAKKGFAKTKDGTSILNMNRNAYFNENINLLGLGIAGEPVAEGLTQITQNLIDRRPFHENLDHAMFSGLMFGTVLSTTPFARGMYLAKYNTFEQNQIVREKNTEIQRLQRKNEQIKNSLTKSKSDTDALGRGQEDIDANNERIKELETDITNHFKVTEKRVKSLSNEGTSLFFETLRQQEEIRQKAENIKNQDNLTDEVKKEKLEKEAVEMAKLDYALDLFRNEGVFGDYWYLFSAQKANTEKVNEIKAEAVDRLNKEGKENPTKEEVEDKAAEVYYEELVIKDSKNNKGKGLNNADMAMTVEDALKTIDKQIDKRIAALNKLDGDYSIDIKQLEETRKLAKANAKRGDNGISIQLSTTNSRNVNSASIHIVANQVKNIRRVETRTHEVGHAVFTKVLGTNELAFAGLSNAIVDYLKVHHPSEYVKLQYLTPKDIPYIDPITNKQEFRAAHDEIVMTFLEAVANENSAIAKDLDKVGGFFGFLAKKGIEDGGGSIDFAGETDAIKFLIGLGKKIKSGSLSTEDIRNIKNNIFIKQAKELNDMFPNFSPLKSSKDVSPEDIKDIKDLIDPLVDKDKYKNLSDEMAKNLWRSSGDGKKAWNALYRPDIQSTLRRLIKANADRLNLDNVEISFDKELYIDGTMLELRTHILAFNPKNTSLWGYINTYKRVKGYNVLKKGEVTKKIVTKSIEAEGVSEIASTDTAEDAVNLKQRAAKEAKEDRKLLITDVLDVNSPYYKFLISEVDAALMFSSDVYAKNSANRKTTKFISDLRNSFSRGINTVDSQAAEKGIDFLAINPETGKRDAKTLERNLRRYRPLILRTMTTTWLSKNFPEAVEKSIGGQLYANGKKVNKGYKPKDNDIMSFVPNFTEDWKGKDVDKEVASVTGRTANHQITRRSPKIMQKVSEDAFVNRFMQKNKKGEYKQRQMRMKGLGYQITVEAGLELIAKDFKEKGPLFDTFKDKQGLINNVLADNIVNDIAMQIERGDVKSSKEIGKLNSTELKALFAGLSVFGERLAETGDFKAAFNGTYPEEIISGKAKRNKIAQELGDYYSWFKKANDMAFLSGQPNFDIETIIRDEIKANDFDTTIDKLVGVKLDLSNIDQLQEFRGDITKIAQVMGWEKAQRFFSTFLYPSGYIGATSATPNVDGELEYNPMFWVDKINKVVELRDRKIEEGANVKSKAIKDLDKKILKYKNSLETGAEPDTRYGGFESFADFETNVLMLLDGYKPGMKNSIGKKSPQNVNVDVSTRKKARDNYKSAALSKDFLLELMDVSKKSLRTKGGMSLGSFGLMMKMINNSGMNSVLASAAHVAYTVKGKISTSTHRYEHLIPRKVVALYLASYALGKNKVKKGEIKRLLKDFSVAIIPQAQDKIVGEFYKSSMPNSWVIGVSSLVRYFNPKTFGKVNLRLIDVMTGNPEKLSNSYADNFKSIKEAEAKRNVKVLKIQANSVKPSQNPKGISVFDFDETAGISDNFVIATKNGVEVRIPSDQWPVVGDVMLKNGYKMDFTDFNKVTNGRPGPLMQKLKNQIKKYGPENVFILTARAPESQQAIHEYLKSEGVNIPLKNITGLGNSTGEAKADWFIEKLANGYNDFYFVDDALPNVEAVDNLLSQFDVKSKVVQARVKSSQDVDLRFNKMLEYATGVEAGKTFSAVTAMKRGKKKGKFRPFVPPGAEDFAGLLGNFIGKGKQGNENRQFLYEQLQRPFSRAYEQLNNARVSIAEDYGNVRSKNKEAVKQLNDKILKGDYTKSDAIRVYLWDKAGYEIPGLAPSIKQKLIDIVRINPELKTFADALSLISRTEKGWSNPTKYWTAGSIMGDLNNIIDGEIRSDLLAEWRENKNIIFSAKNLNKIEALYGPSFRSALEDMLYRMEFGTNRPKGLNSLTNKFIRYLNGSVSAIMFFNGRSATLQMLSTVNFINYADNNIVSAAKAFANQKQFWEDFKELWNSDYLVSRRKGMKNDISTSELAAAVQNADNKTEAAIAWMLEKGFLPTKYADSFAIALGGATFYRNRVKKYIKNGDTKKEAERKAFIDFQEIAEETQQSSRPDLISQQQASLLGRPILAFQNTPMQMTRLMKKALGDLVNRRITKPNQTQSQSDLSNISRILYYGAIQNFIFYSLQSALFALAFDDDEDEAQRKNQKKIVRVANGMADTFLRGTGIYGAIASTAKNTIIKILQEEEKGYNKDVAGIMIELLNLSPPLGSKMRKIVATPYRTYSYQKRAIKNLSPYDLNNPAYEIGASVVEGVFNIPTMRLLNKYKNITEVLNSKNTATQRIFLGLGWDRYGLNVEKPQYLIDARKKRRGQGGGTITF